MLRRVRMILFVGALVVMMFVGSDVFGQTSVSLNSSGGAEKLQKDAQKQWETMKYGLYIHFGMETWTGNWPKSEDLEKIPADTFSPTNVDVRQWAKVAREAGMQYVILTVKHGAGFCLWDSRGYEYDIGSCSSVKKDIIAEFIDACKAEGLNAGIQYSIKDAYNDGNGGFNSSISIPYYKVVKSHITELAAAYPELFFINIISAGKLSRVQIMELNQIISKSNPACIMNFQWAPPNKTEGLCSFNLSVGTVYNEFFWKDPDKVVPIEAIYEKYTKAMKKGESFILNVGPDKSGRIPQKQIDVLMKMKKMIEGKVAVSPQNG